jgi:hypothetical protein
VVIPGLMTGSIGNVCLSMNPKIDDVILGI